MAIPFTLERAQQAGPFGFVLLLFRELIGDEEASPDAVWVVRNNLAAACYRSGKIDEAIAVATRLIADIEREFGADSLLLVEPLANLAVFHWKGTRDLDTAIATLQRTIRIREDNGRLAVDWPHWPGITATLEHYQYDTFRTRFNDAVVEPAYVTFAIGADGRVDRITMAPVSPIADFSFDYRDLEFRPVTATP